MLQFPDFYRQCLMRMWITFMCYIQPFKRYNDSFRPLSISFSLSFSFAHFIHLIYSSFFSFFFRLIFNILSPIHKHTEKKQRKLMQFYLYDIGSDYSSLANVIYCVILFDVYCKIAFLMPLAHSSLLSNWPFFCKPSPILPKFNF